MSVRVERHADGTATVTLMRHAKLNTLNAVALRDLAQAFHGLHDARAAILTGEGTRAFIGGADINEMAALQGPEAAEAFIRGVHGVCAAIRDCPAPVIARIRGWCLGAGLEVAAACDLRVADSSGKFGMPEVRVGIPSVVEAALLPGLIGWGRTRRLLLLAETLDAGTALEWGLVERLVDPDFLDAAVAEWVHMLLEAGPRAIADQKRLIRAWEDLPVRDAIAAGITAFASSFRTDEPARMLGAFAQRRRAPKPSEERPAVPPADSSA
ncbi:MAG: enoyl-CoA hydratase/isomerase family protein [Acetobacteraceae bacterium]|nr:enoyl-CoA hydratase/isomerase family protein [Acetobacteraceae bacterium]